MMMHHPPPHPGMMPPQMMPPQPMMTQQGIPNQVTYQQPGQTQTNMDFEYNQQSGSVEEIATRNADSSIDTGRTSQYSQVQHGAITQEQYTNDESKRKAGMSLSPRKQKPSKSNVSPSGGQR